MYHFDPFINAGRARSRLPLWKSLLTFSVAGELWKWLSVALKLRQLRPFVQNASFGAILLGENAGESCECEKCQFHYCFVFSCVVSLSVTSIFNHFEVAFIWLSYRWTPGVCVITSCCGIGLIAGNSGDFVTSVKWNFIFE